MDVTFSKAMFRASQTHRKICLQRRFESHLKTTALRAHRFRTSGYTLVMSDYFMVQYPWLFSVTSAAQTGKCYDCVIFTF